MKITIKHMETQGNKGGYIFIPCIVDSGYSQCGI